MGVDPVHGYKAKVGMLQGLVIGYITIQCALRLMAPQSIQKVYLPGIAVGLALRDEDTTEWRAVTNGVPVKQTLKGFQRFYDKHHPAADRMKVAFGQDLAVRSKGVMRRLRLGVRGCTTMEEQELQWTRLYTVMTVGIWFMLRRSEHIVAPGKKGKSHLLRRLVVFFDERGSRIPYEKIGEKAAAKVTLNVTFAKTDQPVRIRAKDEPYETSRT